MTDPTDLAALAARLRSAPAPAVAPPTFPTPQIGYAVHDTSVGRLLLARRGDDGPVIASLYLKPTDENHSAAGASTEEAALIRIAHNTGPRILRRTAAFDDVRRELDSYLSGARRDFTVPLELSLATAYQRVVLQTLRRRVPYGARASYGALAAWTDRPKAARAVGTALGANPLCILLPCHRVVGASGALTGYAGGLAAKEQLLGLESRAR
jgi:methylated-DNA-[protein]-cysteine S-methyltransferase